MIKFGNILSNLALKLVGSKLVRRQVTTVIGYISGWLYALGLFAPDVLSRWATDSEQIFVGLIVYGIGMLIDAKRPETPVLIEEQ